VSPRRSLEWRHWRFALVAAILSVAACGFASFVLPSLFGVHVWLTSWDAKWAVSSARWVSAGAIGTVYEANSQVSTLPGLFILLALVVRLGDHFHWVMDYPFPIAHPSMWRLIGPTFFALGATSVLGIDYLADTLGISVGHRRGLAVAVGIFVVVPTCVFGGHPEDLVALALSCLSLALLLRGRYLGAPLVLSVAVLMQPWAGLLIFAFVAACPAGVRLRAFIWSVALPGLFSAMLFALDFRPAYTALVVQPEQGHGQHLPWWSLAGHMTVVVDGLSYEARVGSVTRSVAVVVAIVVALAVLRSPTPRVIVAAAATALLARGVFETELFAWYLAPAAVFLALGVASSRAGRAARFAGYGAAGVVYGVSFGAYFDGGLDGIGGLRGFYLPSGLALALLVVAGGAVIAYLLQASVEPPVREARPEIPGADPLDVAAA
jgi:hypothetical protein